jgi:hypothetical protein
MWERIAGIAIVCGAGLTVYLLALLLVGLRLQDIKQKQ